MCELLGMDCNVPTDIVFSFRGLTRRGGRTGPHRDGWGLCLYDGAATREFREPDPAATSALADFLHAHPIRTKIGIAHVRRATSGHRTVANTHPFTRELWGRTFTFAHNGTIRGVRARPLRRYAPIGSTDSEHGFCHLLDVLARTFRSPPSDPRSIAPVLARLGSDLARYGTFNFLLSDGRALYARCDTHLSHIVRCHPFSTATLKDDDFTVDFREVTTKRDRVAVIATRPLTRNETWTHAEPGTLLVFAGGKLLEVLPSPSPAKRPGRRARAQAAATPG